MDLHCIENALALFDQYYVLQNRVIGGRFNELGTEARKRIVQTKNLIQKIIELESEGKELSKRTSPPGFNTPRSEGELTDIGNSPQFREWNEFTKTKEWKSLMQRQDEIGNELELYTECFYWIASRARAVIRSMPGLGRFDAAGVRNVRNKLLEHPEKGDSGVLLGSFGWGAERGPVVKALRFDHQKDIWPDQGLFVNAEEFFRNLNETTTKAIADPKLIRT